jgi:hypothetical protein
MLMQKILALLFFSLILLISGCDNEPETVVTGKLQLNTVDVGTYELDLTDFSKNTSAPISEPILGLFNSPLDKVNAENVIKIKLKSTGAEIPVDFFFLENDKKFSAVPQQPLTPKESYVLEIPNTLKGAKGESFPGHTVEFTTVPGVLEITALSIAGTPALNADRITNVPVENAKIEITVNNPLDPASVNTESIIVVGNGVSVPLTLSLSDDNKKISITSAEKLKDLIRYQLFVTDKVKGANQETFTIYTRNFYSAPDNAPDFAVISDDQLLTLVQQQTFKYFYDFAHPASGMARERNSSGNTVTSGGSGFGIMALIVGVERGFITRQQALDRMDRILDFLETADRFHGVWPHWLNGDTGKVIPFSTKDNGGDLVETSFLVQGLLTFRQYLNAGDLAEQSLITRINTLWQAVEWDWYRKNNENVLYWHWSPTYNWEMNFAMYGYFEEQITYFLAASSPTHSIPKIVYSNGYGKNGAIVKNNTHYGIKLPLESPAPLFWVHYSYLGLDPHFTDDYANYWEQNVNASLINHAYCVANPKKFVGYSDECWGLTSSDNQNGYGAHSPANDIGVISPTAALSSFPYTPVQSMKALKFFYYKIGDRLWGQYGFYDAFNLTEGWTANSYLAIDQGPIIVMIENYRTGKLWDLFMSAPEVQNGISTLSFTY